MRGPQLSQHALATLAAAGWVRTRMAGSIQQSKDHRPVGICASYVAARGAAHLRWYLRLLPGLLVHGVDTSCGLQLAWEGHRDWSRTATAPLGGQCWECSKDGVFMQSEVGVRSCTSMLSCQLLHPHAGAWTEVQQPASTDESSAPSNARHRAASGACTSTPACMLLPAPCQHAMLCSLLHDAWVLHECSSTKLLRHDMPQLLHAAAWAVPHVTCSSMLQRTIHGTGCMACTDHSPHQPPGLLLDVVAMRTAACSLQVPAAACCKLLAHEPHVALLLPVCTVLPAVVHTAPCWAACQPERSVRGIVASPSPVLGTHWLQRPSMQYSTCLVMDWALHTCSKR